MRRYILGALIVLGLSLSTFAQQGAQNAPAPKKQPAATLLFREDFKPTKEHEVQLTQDLLTSPNLELKKYGPGGKPGNADRSGLLLSNEEDPTHPGKMDTMVWTGVAEGSWIVTLRDKNNLLDLRDTGRLRWRLRQRSLHQVRPVIKLSDGTILVADWEEPLSTYFRETELYFIDIPRWRALDPATAQDARPKQGEGVWKYDVDFSKVDEVGFTDLMVGAGHGTQGNVAVDFIEVYGSPVKRPVAQSQAR